MKKTVAVRFEPPAGIRAAPAAVLRIGTAGIREIGVLLIDLSLRGWFQVEEDSDGKWGLLSAEHLPPTGDRLSGAESALIDAIFVPVLPGQAAA